MKNHKAFLITAMVVPLLLGASGSQATQKSLEPDQRKAIVELREKQLQERWKLEDEGREKIQQLQSARVKARRERQLAGLQKFLSSGEHPTRVALQQEREAFRKEWKAKREELKSELESKRHEMVEKNRQALHELRESFHAE